MHRVGVLALQGDFEAHRRALERAGGEGGPGEARAAGGGAGGSAGQRIQAVEVRTAAELDSVEGLVIPGGESTTMLKILRAEGLFEPLRKFGERRPIFGTCAGAILLAHDVSHPPQESLDLMDIGVERNAYGRQIDSRVVRLGPDEVSGPLAGSEVEAVFIRAPIIRRVGPAARILARYHGDPVLVEQGRHMVATFHPELTDDPRVHRLFLGKLEL
jgi:5'-phosphate synthase pdxT subunit